MPRGIDAAGQVGMAFQTRAIRDSIVASRDLNFIGEPLRGECPGMEKAVQRFGGVLGKEPGRCMAIVANGPFSVAGTQPAGMLIAHYMAIGAGGGVVGEIGAALGIAERKYPHTEENATQYGQKHPGRGPAAARLETHHLIIMHIVCIFCDTSHKENDPNRQKNARNRTA